MRRCGLFGREGRQHQDGKSHHGQGAERRSQENWSRDEARVVPGSKVGASSALRDARHCRGSFGGSRASLERKMARRGENFGSAGSPRAQSGSELPARLLLRASSTTADSSRGSSGREAQGFARLALPTQTGRRGASFAAESKSNWSSSGGAEDDAERPRDKVADRPERSCTPIRPCPDCVPRDGRGLHRSWCWVCRRRLGVRGAARSGWLAAASPPREPEPGTPAGGHAAQARLRVAAPSHGRPRGVRDLGLRTRLGNLPSLPHRGAVPQQVRAERCWHRTADADPSTRRARRRQGDAQRADPAGDGDGRADRVGASHEDRDVPPAVRPRSRPRTSPRR